MATQKARITVTLTPELEEELAQYMTDERVFSKSEAAAQLMAMGAAAFRRDRDGALKSIEPELPPLTDAEREMLTAWQASNDGGRDTALVVLRHWAEKTADREKKQAVAL